MSRSFVVDDADPSVAYLGGNWTNDPSPGTGNFGTVYLQTLHKTSVNGMIEFDFSGTNINVYGTNIQGQDTNNPDPKYECFIDDVSIGRDPPFTSTESHWRLCHADSLADGSHRLRVEVTTVSDDHPFYFDYIDYIPSASVPLEGQVVLIQNTDPIISFDSTWSQYHQTNFTSTSGATAKVNFIGSSLTWVGMIPFDHPHNASIAKYSIDGGSDNQITLTGLPPDLNVTFYNQVYFTTPELDVGPHTLTATYLGSSEETPMLLDYLFIKNGSSNATTIITSSSGTPTGINPPPSLSSSHIKPVGAIVGGVLGGIVILLLVTTILFFWRRRKLLQAYERYGRRHEPFNVNESVAYDTPGISPIQSSHTAQGSSAQLIPVPVHSSTKQQELLNFTNIIYPRSLTPTTSGSASDQAMTQALSTSIVTRQHLDGGVRLNGLIIQDIPPNYTPD